MKTVSRFAFLNCDLQILSELVQSRTARAHARARGNNSARKRVHLRRITLTLIVAFENPISAIK